MFKRFVAVALCLLLFLGNSALADSSFSMAGFDGEKSEHDWSNNGFFTRMEAQTGITFTYAQYTSYTEWQAAKDAMFAEGGRLPDVLFKAALTTQELIRYTDSGQLIDLAPLLEENAPYLWALLQQHPDWLAAITLPNGKIGALPCIQEQAPQNPIWINQDWLKKLGLSMPTDLDSLRQVLTAFRNKDPNGNGKKDEIPLAFLGPWELKFLSHAYGVAVNDYNIYLDDDDQVHFWPLEDSFIQLAQTLHDFYQEGLIDPNGFQTADIMRKVSDEDAAVTYGAFFAPTPLNLLPSSMAKSYGILDPLIYNGRQVYRDLCGQVTTGAFAITSACQDPAALLRWVDTLYTPDGAAEAMAGIQDEDYEMDAEGRWSWKGGLESMSLSRYSQISLYDTGVMPWLFPQSFYECYADDELMRLNGELKRFSTYVRQPYPQLSLTAEQRRQVLDIQDGLGEYVDTMLARFVLGEVALTQENIDAFHQRLNDLGAQEMTAFWQALVP